MGFLSSAGSFLFGSPEKHDRVSTLTQGQEPLLQQLLQALQGKGAGGAFGNAADYYRGLLSDDSADFDMFAAPEMRRFREQIVPGLAEQFAGMGSGALSSSGFRNAAVNAGTDLSERLGAIRAGLRQQGAQGLSGLGSQGLGNFSQDVMTQGSTQGLVPGVAGAVGQGIGIPLGQQLGKWVSGFGQSSPYGNQQLQSGGMIR